ncbi:glycoside hydrolase 43 family protein [Pelagicoccus sp. SDUM812003]|uniref:glycoside hydrolase family 43 protein n=1 Tax=Pelagicoccus sp. SDUM812003 TaxID=3041267 RepID=UPI00280DEF9F|nr:glycoside hydrolase 43 family protein [Pelagicoccus sp. SDUM812003]MDQ8203471.1 glycoside hydrolase 43 family protein [Pelagicoccus sp. SDUM812003]
MTPAKRLNLLLLAICSVFATISLNAEKATNPFIWADVPDVAVIRVDDTYYMSSTTMHMAPGVPIMRSKDLVNWKLLGYAYDTLADNEALRLETERSAYGRGSWASSLRYHDGIFYVSTFSATSGRTHIYKTDDIEACEWEEISFEPSMHDHSLVFDDDGKVYFLFGGGNLRLTELEPDLSGIKEGGFDEVVIEHAEKVATDNAMLHAEGTQVLKKDGMYYVMNICWPQGGMRTQIVHRSKSIKGPYEGRMVLQDKGVAQGCLIDTPEGDWYAVLFQDNGAVGRSPWLVPVKWEDGWPVLGEDGKAPIVLDIEDTEDGLSNIVASDEFDRKPGAELPLAWQWNHNPVNDKWSIGERKGHLRLETLRVDDDVLHARNMLTQRTFGPISSAETKLDVSKMKDGDTAGLIALQRHFGYVGVKQEDGERSIVMVRAQEDEPEVLATIPLKKKSVFFKIECDFRDRADKAYFFYSLDGKSWNRIGEPLQMRYTLPHFMGYRFGLFNWASEQVGGQVDFDFYRIGDRLSK